MKVGKVIGNVVSTRKDEALVGFSLQVIEIQKPGTGEAESQLVAVDTVGAGVGDLVLVVMGGAARVALPHQAPVDATIVGVIDSVGVQ
ncbi:MAG TPA: EutN/CcmL family microcompartment protein [Anaerolineae bacterium]|nr:EutN/CcmL family microcompartment protein [Anaerolineae bacterium]MCB0226790.1 EutN/CcmL family microcompartment protein [Anaerolineae bacterium]MCB0874483.1 EutN/CcmL family microcompartment protein [Thermoleophilia bacterium]MCB9104764.1 EutN/CcmL family microcompartment protein [Anaerolineales bacterium]HRV92326.1 EutN/CcmL family microcompartment protein [Anaerolineae bacterium]